MIGFVIARRRASERGPRRPRPSGSHAERRAEKMGSGCRMMMTTVTVDWRGREGGKVLDPATATAVQHLKRGFPSSSLLSGSRGLRATTANDQRLSSRASESEAVSRAAGGRAGGRGDTHHNYLSRATNAREQIVCQTMARRLVRRTR